MTDRFVFRCRYCSVEISLPGTTKRVSCACGREFDDPASMQSPAASRSKELFWVRLEQCENCPSYMGNRRCKLVGLGCRNEFRALLESKEGKCPSEKW